VTVKVSKIVPVQGEAQGPGEVSGPGLQVTITVTNKSQMALPMDLALTNLYYGPAATPGGELSGPGASPLAQPIAAGGQASGVYVFAVPADDRRRIRVEFSYTTNAPAEQCSTPSDRPDPPPRPDRVTLPTSAGTWPPSAGSGRARSSSWS